MDEKLHVFESPAITVTWSRGRCIHVAECVRGLPGVFQPGRRPWVDPGRAAADRVAEVVCRCPTGALHFERRDGGAAEAVPATTVVTPSRRGPLHLRGDVELVAGDGTVVARDTRMALCRCGTSKNRPFCDGSHWETDFRDDGLVGEGGQPPQSAASGPLRITFGVGGPLYAEGPFVLASARAGVRRELGGGRLCRCGASRNKPFCDGSHSGTDLRES
jgi:CDGSH-type Zn-finger protein/uncharacterized Fe-S cluster protein YjdI